MLMLPSLTSAAIPVVLDVDVDGILEVAAEFLRFLLRESIPCNDCRQKGQLTGRWQLLPSDTYPQRPARR